MKKSKPLANPILPKCLCHDCLYRKDKNGTMYCPECMAEKIKKAKAKRGGV